MTVSDLLILCRVSDKMDEVHAVSHADISRSGKKVVMPKNDRSVQINIGKKFDINCIRQVPKRQQRRRCR
jgi:hypothetical protein